MNIQKLKHLLRQEESPKLDFKEMFHISTESEKKELAKDVIAMANSRGGRGYIIFGIKDKTKKVMGVNAEEMNEEKIQQIIYNRCNPPVPIRIDKLQYQKKDVVVLTIYKSEQKPHQMIQNGAFYIRRGSTTDVARKEEIASMFQQHGLFSYERVILSHVPLEQLDNEFLREYLPYDNLLLEGIGIIGKDIDSEEYRPTIGGLLLFGHNPYLFLPQVYIQLSYNNHIKLFTGNILRMLDEVESFIKELCADDHYPLEALFEAIVNAVTHRDYLDVSRGIMITIHPKNIEVINPGVIVSGNKVYSAHKENMPKRRNPWLYQRLLTIDKKGRFLKYGLGIKRIKESYKNIGQVKFVNIGSENVFKVILPGFKMKV